MYFGENAEFGLNDYKQQLVQHVKQNPNNKGVPNIKWSKQKKKKKKTEQEWNTD